MKITVTVEMLSTGGRSSVEINIGQEDIEALAEAKVMEMYACNRCEAKNVEFSVEMQ